MVNTGDVFSALIQVSNNAYLDIQPASAYNAVVYNIYYTGAVEFYWSDGSNNIKFDSDAYGGGAGSGARKGLVHHVTNSYYLRVKNVSGSAIYIGYNGRYETDVYSIVASVTTGQYLTIQPLGTDEAMIHNVYYAGAAGLYWTNGSVLAVIESDATATGGAFLNRFVMINNARYVRVKNNAATTKLIGFSGLYTKKSI